MSRLLELTAEAAAAARREIARAVGHEVCFAASVDERGRVTMVRVLARGNDQAVLAAARGLEPGTLVIHNHPSGDLTPSDADLQVAAQLYAEGLGLAIIDNGARELYVVVEPTPATNIEPLDLAEIEGLLAPGGPLSQAHPGYEDRPSQREMARAVAEAYNQGGVALLEAGTGTGKSVAYLVPAIRWSAANRERTVVSTNTINLQEQLVGKDLPFLRRALGEPFRFALVKGRGNYISIRRARLAAASELALFEDEQRTQLRAILEWLSQTREGSLQDLPFEPGSEVWDEVVSDSDVCLRARCPHFEQCFYQRARRDATSADVLVVNHHLLFSDLAVRLAQDNYTAPAVLPPYRRLILDEAHNLEDSATTHLGANVTGHGLLRVLARLDRRGRGLLLAVEQELMAAGDDLLARDALRISSEVLRPDVERGRSYVAEFFQRLEQLLRGRAPDGVLRLGEDFTGEQAWQDGPAETLESLLVLLGQLAGGLQALRERIGLDREWTAALAERLVELQGVENRIRAAAGGLRLAFTPGADTVPMVRWIEATGTRERRVTVRAAPIDLSDLLREGLFDRVDTAVLTSATLATRDGFEFTRRRLGLATGLRLREAVFSSPFAFEEQAVVAIPADLPVAKLEIAPDEAIAAATEDLARMCDGGVFVLFTSYRSLRAVAAELRRRGVERRWPLFVQGEGQRTKLLVRFTEAGRGILLGVASFWEGVDVPGDPLRGLIIAKLPFRVPTEPLTAARLEAIDRDGGNSFYDYMLPHAALRLKQGFGRLIRSRRDRGAVVILDRRIQVRNYGGYFLQSLPPAPVVVARWVDLQARLREFYTRSTDADRSPGAGEPLPSFT